LDHLALDQEAVLVGFSMGTGEVTRYLGTYGSHGVSKAVLIGSIPPYVRQTEDNPQGVPRDVFEGLKQAAAADRYAFLDSFLTNLYNADVSIPETLSDSALRASSQVAYGSGPYATYASIDTWLTDFRGDLPKIDIPVLAIHGTADRILPFAVTTGRLRDEGLIADLTVVEIADGPHNVGWTHPDEVNSALLSFLGGSAGDRDAAMATAARM
jgi:non-heme chloroperoxidase